MSDKNNKTLSKVMGSTKLSSYIHPLFRSTEEHAKIWKRFIAKSPYQKDDVNSRLNASVATTKLPLNSSLGATAEVNNGRS